MKVARVLETTLCLGKTQRKLFQVREDAKVYRLIKLLALRPARVVTHHRAAGIPGYGLCGVRTLHVLARLMGQTHDAVAGARYRKHFRAEGRLTRRDRRYDQKRADHGELDCCFVEKPAQFPVPSWSGTESGLLSSEKPGLETTTSQSASSVV